MSVRELLDLEPAGERERDARRVSSTCGWVTARRRGRWSCARSIAATYRDTGPGGDPRSRPARSRRTSSSSTFCSSRATTSSRCYPAYQQLYSVPARHRLRRRRSGSSGRRRIPLRPGRARTARDAAHAADRDQHARTTRPARCSPPKSSDGSTGSPRSVGARVLVRRGLPVARDPRRRAAGAADAEPRRRQHQRRDALEALRAAGPADRLDRRTGGPRREVLGRRATTLRSLPES